MTARALPRRTVILGTAAALVAVLTGVPAAHAAVSTQPSTGSLVLVGGGLASDNTEIYSEIIKRAGGSKARIGVLTAASIPESQDPDAADPDKCSNSACNGAYYASLFRKHGAADAQWIPIDLDHIANADSDTIADQVKSMTGFFFGGGDQYRYVTTLLHGHRHTDSRVLAAIRDRLAHGAVIAGSSAGAQIAAGPDMVTGGDSYPALRDGSSPGYFDDPSRLGYLPDGGFGFLNSGLIDTHTGAEGREGRALRLASDTGHDRVYALDENTALVVDAPGTQREAITVLGANGVGVFDLRRACTRHDRLGWSLRNAGYTYLTDGDHYDPRRWLASPAQGKHRLVPDNDTAVPGNADVFYSIADPAGTPYSFRDTARTLAATSAQRSATATTYETGPRFRVTFTKKPGFSAWAGGAASTPPSLVGMRIGVTPE
ncbi:cyanophycinase [Streptomyces sp. 2231.1]|uniref:cyanophycinase n=1 Tax=Streptomyces sp. 2231.1 TaxID=1855347 RepID=UPI00089B3C45|nr:cyanophycinase [Streptomyces sp. 2231.1]SEE22769.1 cyanophycinase [Streptomyces sp. 2231.1]